jgi:hypothetical protein
MVWETNAEKRVETKEASNVGQIALCLKKLV